MRDLRSPNWIKLKAVLFLFLGLLSSILLLLNAPMLRVFVLLSLAVWCFCRFYYFAFYVIEHYVDPSFRFSGLLSVAHYLLFKSEANSMKTHPPERKRAGNSPPANSREEVVADASRLIGGGAELEMILLFLREKRFDKIDSINAIRTLYGKAMPEAKEIVDHSDTWTDRFHTDMEFRENGWKALREIAASQDPNLPNIIIEGDPDAS